jgi:hypothetical protein
MITPTQLAAAMAGVGLNRSKLAAALGIQIRSVIYFMQGDVDRPRWLPAAMRLLADRGVHFGPHDGVSFGENAFGDKAITSPLTEARRARDWRLPITPAELHAGLDAIGMTQTELARLVGASQASVSLFLSGRRAGADWLLQAAVVIEERALAPIEPKDVPKEQTYRCRKGAQFHPPQS